MGKYFDDETKLEVLKAYLVDGLSHRQIQRDILNYPAPARGGGFLTMEILHQFGVKGEHKGLYANSSSDEFVNRIANRNLYEELSNYINFQYKAKEQIEHKNFNYNEKDTERYSNIKLRVYQNVIRARVLENYNYECAFCNINKPDLLVCSHIKPWAEDTQNRLNPQNVICLCPLHDKLLDKGYFSLDAQYNIVFSEKADLLIKELFRNLSFKTPTKEPPNLEFLEYHRKTICGLLV